MEMTSGSIICRTNEGYKPCSGPKKGALYGNHVSPTPEGIVTALFVVFGEAPQQCAKKDARKENGIPQDTAPLLSGVKNGCILLIGSAVIFSVAIFMKAYVGLGHCNLSLNSLESWAVTRLPSLGTHFLCTSYEIYWLGPSSFSSPRPLLC